MNKDKLTTILGGIVAAGTIAQNAGLDFGHVGHVTGVGAITAVATLVWGWFTNKNK